jgi:hypothetical protein
LSEGSLAAAGATVEQVIVDETADAWSLWGPKAKLCAARHCANAEAFLEGKRALKG